MTRHSSLDLSGSHLFNENDGVVQGQICGQALMTKLLRKKGGKAPKELSLSLAFQNDASAHCMSPIGRPKKLKFHKHNLYENMNNMSSIDTESCTSDDIFSDSSGQGVHTTIDDLEAPVFVAQFDPIQLTSESDSPDQILRQQDLTQASYNNAPGSARKTGVPWSASLPVVAEEDSQSEQSSHLGIWRNGQGMQSPEKENAGVQAIMAVKDQILKRQGDPNETMDLLETDRIGSPRAIPIAIASPPSILHSRPFEDRDGESQVDSKPSTPNSTPKKHHRDSKRSKDEYIREAVDRRIRQAMEDAMHNAQSEDLSDVRRLESIDSELISADSSRRSPTSINSNVDSFHHHHGHNNHMWQSQRQGETFLPKAFQVSENEISNAIQELLLQQQTTLKEMANQNSQYRQELLECQEIFDKWKTEREKQRSTIQDLVKQKEAYATEASFLRNEMSSIRQELEALRKQTAMHAANLQSPQTQQHPPRLQQLHYEDSPSPGPKQSQGFRHKQPQQESPSANASPPKTVKVQYHPEYGLSESQSEDVASPLGLKFTVFSNPPPPPPPRPIDQRTPKRTINKPDMTSPSPNKTQQDQPKYASPMQMKRDKPVASEISSPSPSRIKQEQQKYRSPSPSQVAKERQDQPRYRSPSPNSRITKEKPLTSGLKQSNPDSARKNRSVKFHDPPLSQQWTVTNHINDDRLLEQSFQDSKQPESREEEEEKVLQSDKTTRGEEVLTVYLPEEESQTSVDAPTPIAANGRKALGMPASATQHANAEQRPEVAELPSAAYKYRLETMKKNRQQRTGRTDGSPAPRDSPGLSSPERKRRGRSRPPMAGHHG